MQRGSPVDTGWLNEAFIDYCKEKNLDDIMSVAKKKAARQAAREKDLPREVGR